MAGDNSRRSAAEPGLGVVGSGCGLQGDLVAECLDQAALVRRRTGHFGRAERDQLARAERDQLAQADRERRQRRPPAECTADRRHHDPLDPNDEGSTADRVPPGTGSRPAAAHEMPGTCRSTMTPPGIGATRAEVTGMVPSTLLKWWCPYTPMCREVPSARSPIRSRSRPTVIAVTAESTAESTTMVVITRLHRCSHRHTRRVHSCLLYTSDAA